MTKFGILLGAGVMALALAGGTALADSNQLPFTSSGSGTQIAGGPPGCQFGGVCTVTSTGTATSSHLGTGPYTSTLTLFYNQVSFPTPTTYCVPAAGNSVLTAADGDQLFIATTGQVCGGTAAGAVHTLTGTYTITGGTGRFTGATGSGTESGSDDGGANSTYTLSGTIGY